MDPVIKLKNILAFKDPHIWSIKYTQFLIDIDIFQYLYWIPDWQPDCAWLPFSFYYNAALSSHALLLYWRPIGMLQVKLSIFFNDVRCWSPPFLMSWWINLERNCDFVSISGSLFTVTKMFHQWIKNEFKWIYPIIASVILKSFTKMICIANKEMKVRYNRISFLSAGKS